VDAGSQLRGGEGRVGAGHGAGQVDQGAVQVRMAAQQGGQHGAGAAADVDHGAQAVPSAGQFEVKVGLAVAGWAHQGVEVRSDICSERALA
jgi:hypothetical protein